MSATCRLESRKAGNVPSEKDYADTRARTGAFSASLSARYMQRTRPPIIERYWYSIDWDVEALWKLDLNTEQVPIERLTWHFDVPVWPDPKGDGYRVTPQEVLDHPAKHQREYDRVSAADLSFPIEVYEHGRRLMILDGIHRLAKASLEGRREMRVRKVPQAAVRKTQDRFS